MSEELQAEVIDDGVTIDGPEDITLEAVDDSQGLATPNDDQHDKNGTDSPALTEQEKHQKEVNKQHKKYRDEERARLAVEKRLEEKEARLKELEAQINVAPEIPPVPDPYDDNFESKVSSRDEAIRNRAAWDQEQSSIQAEQLKTAQEVQQREQQAVQDRVSKYAQRAQELKVSESDLQAAGQVVGQYVSPDLASHILDDSDGPLITTYLASNPTSLDDLRSMSLGNAAIHIANVIKPNLSAMKPKPSGAPEPIDTLRGAGVAPKQAGPEGATYE